MAKLALGPESKFGLFFWDCPYWWQTCYGNVTHFFTPENSFIVV